MHASHGCVLDLGFSLYPKRQIESIDTHYVSDRLKSEALEAVPTEVCYLVYKNPHTHILYLCIGFVRDYTAGGLPGVWTGA